MIYTIYLRDGDMPQEAIFIKDGFSPMAMIFSSLWFFYHRMWCIGITFFMISMLTRYFMLYLYNGGFLVFAAIFLLSMCAGTFANDLRQMRLLRKKYRFTSAVVANNILEAKVKFFNSLDNATGCNNHTGCDKC